MDFNNFQHSSSQIQQFWQKFLAQSNFADGKIPTQYHAWSFGAIGGNGEMADQLALLVLQGQKTASSSLLQHYKSNQQALPQVGEYNIILNSQREPVCITKTTEVSIAPYASVDEKFAIEEGDGSLENWRKIHWEYYSTNCPSGFVFTEEALLVCEKFEKVFP